MPETINPYQQWLGLSRQIQAPNHFQLLNVRPNISDERELNRAVKAGVQKCLERMARVPPNQHPELQAQVRQQIQLAQTTLLDAGSRTAYLSQLTQEKPRSSTAQANAATSDQTSSSGQNQGKPKQSELSSSNRTNQIRKRPSAEMDLLPPGAVPKERPTRRVSSSRPSLSGAPNLDDAATLNAPGAVPNKPTPAIPVAQQNRSIEASVPTAIPIATSAAEDSPTAKPASSIHATSAENPSASHTETSFTTDGPVSEATETPVVKPIKGRRRVRLGERISQLFIIAIMLGSVVLIYRNWSTIKALVAQDVDQQSGQPDASSNAKISQAESGSSPTNLANDSSTTSNKATTPARSSTVPSPQPVSNPAQNHAKSTNQPAKQDAATDDTSLARDRSQAAATDPANVAKQPLAPIKNQSSPVITESFNLDNHQLGYLDRLLSGAARSLRRRDKQVAIDRISEAKQFLSQTLGEKYRLADDQQEIEDRIESLEWMTTKLDQFWNRVISVCEDFKGTPQIYVGEQVLGFVEANTEYALLRNQGSNIRYDFYVMPSGLAVALVESAAIDNVYTWSMELATIYAIDRRFEGQYEARLAENLKKTEDSGRDCSHLKHFLEFQFRPLRKTLGNSERIKWVKHQPSQRLPEWLDAFRNTHRYPKPQSIRLDQAGSIAKALYFTPTETLADESLLLQELLAISIRAGDASLAEDAICDLERIASIDLATMQVDSYLDIGRSKLSEFDKRVLIERGFQLLKDDASDTVSPRKTRQLRDMLLLIARRSNMIDAVRRLTRMD